MADKKKVRYVNPSGYVDIHFTITRVFGKKIARRDEVFMIIHKHYFKGEDTKMGKDQTCLPIPAECTAEQQVKLFEKYVEITTNKKGNDKSISAG